MLLVMGYTGKKASHPTRVRGLKQIRHPVAQIHEPVAPHAGAWIETFHQPERTLVCVRRTPRGCVD